MSFFLTSTDRFMAGEAEHELIAQIQRGNRSALGMLLQAQQDRLFTVCLRMLGHREDAADALQEAMVRIIENIDRFRGEARLSTWMMRITMNQCLTHRRRARVRRTLSLDSPAAGNGRASAGSDLDDQATALRRQLADDREPGPAQRVEESERLALLERALEAIAADHRAILVLRDIEQMDYQQIADVLEVKIGTVKSRLFRARAALREQMDAYDQQSPRSLDDDGQEDPAPHG